MTQPGHLRANFFRPSSLKQIAEHIRKASVRKRTDLIIREKKQPPSTLVKKSSSQKKQYKKQYPAQQKTTSPPKKTPNHRHIRQDTATDQPAEVPAPDIGYEQEAHHFLVPC
jgi:hypothetical protein